MEANKEIVTAAKAELTQIQQQIKQTVDFGTEEMGRQKMVMHQEWENMMRMAQGMPSKALHDRVAVLEGGDFQRSIADINGKLRTIWDVVFGREDQLQQLIVQKEQINTKLIETIQRIDAQDTRLDTQRRTVKALDRQVAELEREVHIEGNGVISTENAMAFNGRVGAAASQLLPSPAASDHGSDSTGIGFILIDIEARE